MQLPRYHRLRHSLYRLEGSHCDACEKSYFPPRRLCPDCGLADLPSRPFAGTGTVYSYSGMSQPPRGFGSVGPYTVAMVQLDDGPMVMTQLTDIEGVDLSIGMPVEMVTRKLREHADHGYILYGYKFRPRMVPADVENPAASPTGQSDPK